MGKENFEDGYALGLLELVLAVLCDTLGDNLASQAEFGVGRKVASNSGGGEHVPDGIGVCVVDGESSARVKGAKCTRTFASIVVRAQPR